MNMGMGPPAYPCSIQRRQGSRWGWAGEALAPPCHLWPRARTQALQRPAPRHAQEKWLQCPGPLTKTQPKGVHRDSPRPMHGAWEAEATHEAQGLLRTDQSWRPPHTQLGGLRVRAPAPGTPPPRGTLRSSPREHRKFYPRLGLFQKLAQWPRNKPPLEFLQSVDGQVGTTGHTARDIASPDSRQPLSRRLSRWGPH